MTSAGFVLTIPIEVMAARPTDHVLAAAHKAARRGCDDARRSKQASSVSCSPVHLREERAAVGARAVRAALDPLLESARTAG